METKRYLLYGIPKDVHKNFKEVVKSQGRSMHWVLINLMKQEIIRSQIEQAQQ